MSTDELAEIEQQLRTENLAETQKQVALIESEVAESLKLLTLPAGSLLPFTPTLLRVQNQPPLMFKKLTLPQTYELQESMPKIPPKFTLRPWRKGEWEALPEEMKEYWRTERDPIKEEMQQTSNAVTAILLASAADEATRARIETLHPVSMDECLNFVLKVSGVAKDAQEIIDWFRQQRRRAGLRVDLPGDNAEVAEPTMQP